MAKRFFYVSMGILALTVAYNLGARSVEADWDPDGMGCVAGVQEHIWWAQSGEAWELNGRSWTVRPEYDLPVSASSVKMTGNHFGNVALVTTSDDVWVYLSGSGWQQADPFPGSGTPTTKSLWGDVKRKFR